MNRYGIIGLQLANRSVVYPIGYSIHIDITTQINGPPVKVLYRLLVSLKPIKWRRRRVCSLAGLNSVRGKRTEETGRRSTMKTRLLDRTRTTATIDEDRQIQVGYAPTDTGPRPIFFIPPQ